MLTLSASPAFILKNGEVGLATATAGGDTVLCGARGTWTTKADLRPIARGHARRIPGLDRTDKIIHLIENGLNDSNKRRDANE